MPEPIIRAQNELVQEIFKYSQRVAEDNIKGDDFQTQIQKLQSAVMLTYQVLIQSISDILRDTQESLIDNLDRMQRESSGMER